jgi:hypothetical protein
MPFPDVSQFTRPDGSVDQAAMFAALQAYYAENPYNPEGDPSLGSNVVLPYGYTGGNQGYAEPNYSPTNIGATMPGWGDTYHFDPGQNPYFGFGDGRDTFFSSDPAAVGEYEHDQDTRRDQGILTVGALVGGGALASSLTGGATAGTAAATPATTYPYVAGGAVTGSAIPGVTSATTAANAAAAGIAPIAGAAAGTGSGVTSAVDTAGGIADVAGGALSNWPVIVGSLISGLTGIAGSNAQKDASEAAVAESRRQFDTARGDALPYIEGGHSALARLRALTGIDSGTPDYSGFESSPDYLYAKQEAEKAGSRRLAAIGKANSGEAVQELSRTASGVASQNLGTYANRLASIAGLGQTTAANNAVVGANSAATVGHAQMNGGDARSSGYAALNNSVQSGLSNYLLMQQLARMPKAA